MYRAVVEAHMHAVLLTRYPLKLLVTSSVLRRVRETKEHDAMGGNGPSGRVGEGVPTEVGPFIHVVNRNARVC
jgi:hypothetical protein